MLQAELVAEEGIEGRHHLLLHRSGSMGVQVQRDTDLAVPEHLADDLRVDPQLQQKIEVDVAVLVVELVLLSSWQRAV
jgi:hypothetical protein